MLEALAAAVDELEVPPAGEPLREVLDICDRLMAKTALALRTFDAAEGYEARRRHLDDGMVAPPRRPVIAGGGSPGLPLAACRLPRLPVTATAWAEGALSVG